jgi:hypothetical protein
MTQDTGELLLETAATIGAQPEVPRSPGSMVDSQPRLCAGAAIVYQAARKVLDAGALRRAAEDMFAAGADGILRKASELGLDTHLVRLLVVNNDACPDDDRRERMVTFIRQLAAARQQSVTVTGSAAS